MSLDHQDPDVWSLIAARASSLFERLGNDFVAVESDQETARREARWRTWLDRAAGGDPRLFAQRLQNDHLDESQVRKMLSEVRMRDTAPLPAWANLLQDIVAASGAGALKAPRAKAAARTKEPVPFEELVQPFITVAGEQLRTRTDSATGHFAPSVYSMLEFDLLEWLSFQGGLVFEFEFSLYRGAAGIDLERVVSRPGSAAPSHYYRRFVQDMNGRCLLGFLAEYSALARRLARTCEMWIDANVDCLQRLAADYNEIAEVFAAGADPGPAVAIEEVMSNRRSKGRLVKVLTFESGLKLVYKVKDLGTEEAYFKLLGWFNSHDIQLPFKELLVLNKGEYGWVEYVQASLDVDDEQIRRYYQRFGMLLCLLHLLEATDIGLHNIVVAGDHPVLIDLETILHPRAILTYQEVPPLLSTLLDNRNPVYSVLRIGLLSSLDVQEDEKESSRAGKPEEGMWLTQWQNVNTDRMAFRWVFEKPDGRLNRPTLNGAAVMPYEHVDEITRGFRLMYAFQQTHQDALLAPDGPLRILARQKTRYVFRSSPFYSALRKRSLHPECLRAGVDRSIELETLSRSLLKSEEHQRFWPLLRAEREALEEFDIPIFEARSDDTLLHAGGESLMRGHFLAASYSCVEFRLRHLNAGDRERQLAVVRGFFSSKAPAIAWGICVTDPSKPKPASYAPLIVDLFTRSESESIIRRAEEALGWQPAKELFFERRDWISGGILFLDDHGSVAPDLSGRLDSVIRTQIREVWGAEVGAPMAPQIIRYGEGGYHHEHSDTVYDTDPRLFTVVCYLNDNYEGGRTGFSQLGLAIAPKAGRSILFPASYLHYSEIVRSGVKYVLAVWLEITHKNHLA